MSVNRVFLRAVFLTVAVILLIGSPGVRAQQITGRVVGSVLDASGAAVPNAQITITNQDTGVVRTTVTTGDGLYNDPQVPPGNYTISVQAPGFSTTEVKNVLVSVGSDTREDLKMEVGTVNQTVTVTESAPQVNTTNSSLGGTVDEQKVADLPLNGRNWTDLTLMQTGVTQLRNNLITAGISGMVYSSMGADIRSNNYLLDGAVMQNIFAVNNASVLGTSLGVDGIREYKIVTNLFSAEYGLVMGSQTTIVSKSGANQWHGDAYDYLRNSALDSRQHFDKLDANNVNGCGTNKSLVYPCKRNEPYQRNNFGGSFGGPIIRDKTFFYAVFEGLREKLGITTQATTFSRACFVPAGTTSIPSSSSHLPASINNSTTGATPNPFGTCVAGGPPVINVNSQIQKIDQVFPQPITSASSNNYSFPFVRPSSEQYGQIRLDHNFSGKDNAFFRYTHDDADQTAPGSYLPLETQFHSSSQYITAAENHVLSPTLLNTFRASFSRTQLIDNFIQTPGQTPIPALDAYYNIPVSIGPGSGITAFASNNANGPPPGSIQNIVTGTDDIFWTKGKHAMKFGFMYNHFQDNLTYYLFAGGSAAFSNLSQFFNGNYSTLQWIYQGGNQRRSYIYQTFGSYFQDDFRIKPRLTLNLGIRYEPSTVPRSADGLPIYSLPNPATAKAQQGTQVPGIYTNATLHNISPRLGLAWDVFGTGKTAIRLGGGIYYNVGLLGGLLTNNSCCTAPLANQVLIQNNTAGAPPVPLQVPLDPMVAVAQAPPPVGLGVPLFAPRTIQYQGKQPTLGQWNFSIDQQLAHSMALSVSYAGSHGWHFWKIDELNPVLPVGFDATGLPYRCSNAVGGGPATVPTAAAPCTTFPTTRPNQNLTQIYGEVPESEGWYNALEVSLTKKLTRGLQFQASYTWERQEDAQQNQSGADSTERYQAPGNPNNIDKGVSTYNVPQNLRFNAIYHVPDLNSDHFAAKIEHGWWVAGILAVQAGSPVNVTDGANRSLAGNANGADRPNLDPSFNRSKLTLGSPFKWFDYTMFDLQPSGTYGNAAVNIVNGPPYRNVDFSLNKDTRIPKLGEAGMIQFRAEFFNIFNITNFGPPNGGISSTAATSTACGGQFTAAQGASSTIVGGPCNGNTIAINSTAGVISSTVNGNNSAREIQLSLKVIF